ncbi:MAG: hypothetical protein WDO17_24430 [Alphaproteobacteria bacterium]
MREGSLGSERWSRSLAIALFLVAWGVLSWPWLSGAVTIPYDAKALFQAELQFLANAIHQGQSPFWSPNVFGGVPQIADPQSLIFSPMVLLALLAPHPSFHALDVAVLAMLALGGLSVLMFFQDRGWHPAGGIVAALAFAFGASASWRIQHIGQIESLVFFAIALWLLARALERASIGYGLGAGIAAGLMVVQPDQVAFLGALVLVGYVADYWLAQPSLNAALRRSARPLGAASLAALLIMAVPVLLTMLFAESSDRASFHYAEATQGSLHPASLLTMLVGGLFSPDYAVPYWGPYSEAWDPKHLFLSPNMSQVYAGALPMLAILVFGVARGLAWTREIRFFSLALIALIVYALGRYTPAYRLLFEFLPGVSVFRRPADATFLIGACTAILGGYLVHRVVNGGASLARSHGAMALGLIAAWFAASVGVALWAGHFHDAAAPLAKAAAWATAGAAVLLVLRSVPRRAPIFGLLIAASLMAADLRLNNGPNESTALPPARFEMLEPDTRNETILMLKRLLAQRLPSDRRDRVELLGVGFEWPNAPMIHGFDHTLGYNPLRLADVSDATGARDYIAGPWQRTFSPLFNSYHSLMADMLGLRYIVSSVHIGEVDPNLKPGDLRFLAHTRDGYVYENPGALPRVLFAVDWMAADFDALIEQGQWPDFDPRRTVLLESEPGVDPPPQRKPGECPRATARLSHYENTVVDIDADSFCGGFVVLNDVWHPWWTVTVDGKPAEVLKANVIFRAVEVAPGRHRLRFEFKPVAGAFAELSERLFGEEVETGEIKAP